MGQRTFDFDRKEPEKPPASAPPKGDEPLAPPVEAAASATTPPPMATLAPLVVVSSLTRLGEALAKICREHLLAEKWLLAPNLRIGRQWLDTLSRHGHSLVNVRVKTLRSLAIELAAPAMARDELTFLGARGGEMLMERVLVSRRKLGLAYLAHLEPSAGLSRAVYQALVALRLARLAPDDLSPQSFEVAEKGRDLRLLLREYMSGLATEKRIDYPGVLELALQRLSAGGSQAFPADALLLVPEGTIAHDLERRVLGAFPKERRLDLPIDEPICGAGVPPAGMGGAGVSPAELCGASSIGVHAGGTPATQGTPATLEDRELLRHVLAPDTAPQPRGDGTARIVRAVGEVNEVRAALRDLVARGIPWDDVELLHSDVNTYVPLVYEVLAALAPPSDDDPAADLTRDLPVTFAEGIPIRYSRPGRALALWVAWIRDDFPQDTLLKMLREGLLEIPAGKSAASPSRLARLLRRVGIGFGRNRYLMMLAERKKQVEFKLAHPEMSRTEEDEVDQDRQAALARQIDELETLEQLFKKLLDLTPAWQASPQKVVDAAKKFLITMTRRGSQLDNAAGWRLTDELDDIALWLPPAGTDTSLNIWSWLAALPTETRVLGSGPRPGSLHVAPLLAGGHTGRGHTYLLGLDDGRFPGAGLEDPLLLDQERRELSPELTTGAESLEERAREFARLLARFRGRVTLSYSVRSVTSDREMFPSPVLLAAFRILSGQHEGEQLALAHWLDAQGPPASFAPATAEEALGESEWWTRRLCGEEEVLEAEPLVETRFPHLARGRIALEARQSQAVTIYDGLVPEAGRDLDPTTEPAAGEPARVMSAHGLTTIGRCPLAYFYGYGLKLEQPHPAGFDPEVWLDHSALGLLLHELFETFIRELVATGRTPEYARDRARLFQLLEGKIEEYRHLIPPPRRSAFQKQRDWLVETAETFLREEEAYCLAQQARPVYLEASLGMPLSDEHSTPLDTTEPMPLSLPAGQRIWLRGRVDRIDELASPPEHSATRTFAIWDYKTGGTWGYEPADPFRQGRKLQPYLYVTLVEHRLRQAIGPQARVGLFGFFFPARKAAGERISWTPGELKDGGRIVELLAKVVAGGVFLATDDEGDCKFCDFREACGDVRALTRASHEKRQGGDPLLGPHRELRPQ